VVSALGAVSVPACGGSSLPAVPPAQVRVEDYVAVPFTPRPPPVEIVPPRPRDDAKWADGTWEWAGERYRWQPGGWVIVPRGLRRTRWVAVRRADGQLFFAAASWLDAQGKPVTGPEPLVRARSRASDIED
jgi:hypothetical protein